MMKKSLMIMAVAVLLVSLAGFACAEEKESTFSFEFSASALTKYVGEVSGVEFFGREVIQPSFTISHNPSGLYANLWGSYSPKDGFNSDEGDEVDYIFGINRNVGPVNVDFYYAYYNLVDLDKHGVGDAESIGAKLTFSEIWKVISYIAAEYSFIREVDETEPSQDGLSYRTGISFSPVKDLKVDLSLSGHGQLYGANTEVVSSTLLKATYEFQVTESFKITPEINLQKRLGNSEDDGGLTKDLVWGGVTAALYF